KLDGLARDALRPRRDLLGGTLTLALVDQRDRAPDAIGDQRSHLFPRTRPRTSLASLCDASIGVVALGERALALLLRQIELSLRAPELLPQRRQLALLFRAPGRLN